MRRYHGISPGFPVHYHDLEYGAGNSEKQGICSFILSVVDQVVAAHTDHPMARITANMIRQEEDENEKQRRQHQVFRKGFR